MIGQMAIFLETFLQHLGAKLWAVVGLLGGNALKIAGIGDSTVLDACS
jgi:hypothetical protein